MSDVVRAYRDVKTNVKSTVRDVGGTDLKDHVGNAGDELRKDLGNLGDDVRDVHAEPDDSPTHPARAPSPAE